MTDDGVMKGFGLIRWFERDFVVTGVMVEKALRIWLWRFGRCEGLGMMEW